MFLVSIRAFFSLLWGAGSSCADEQDRNNCQTDKKCLLVLILKRIPKPIPHWIERRVVVRS